MRVGNQSFNPLRATKIRELNLTPGTNQQVITFDVPMYESLLVEVP